MKKTVLGFIFLILCPLLVFSQPKLIIHQVDYSNFPLLKAYVSVLDDAGESIKGLDKAYFSLIEDGHRINTFRCSSIFPKKEWLSLVLAIDKSGSMKGEPLREAKKGAKLFIQKASLLDRIALVIFDKEVFWKIDFTDDKDLLEKEIDSLIAKRDTALYDTLVQSVVKLKRIDSPRKAVVILTDGKDTERKPSIDECLNQLKEAEIPIYIIGLGKEVNKAIVRRIAEQSRGNYFFALTSSELQRIYSTIASQLENQYIITYQFNGDEKIATHSLNMEVSINNQSARDKILYSFFTDSMSEEKSQKSSILWFKDIVLPGLIGCAIGVIVFFILAQLLFKEISNRLILKSSFIILGALLFAILATLIVHFI
jgi:VWFA-related protein